MKKNLSKIVICVTVFLLLSCGKSTEPETDISQVFIPLENAGDLNLNDTPYEIADAVLFADYFVYGDSVFTIDIDEQSAVSDINNDGIVLTVADLVYQIRVIVGDASPNPQPQSIGIVDGSAILSSSGVVTVNTGTEVGAVHLVVEGGVTPTLFATQMTLQYHFDGTNTSILVYSLDGNSFSGGFLSIGTSDVVEISIGSAIGEIIKYIGPPAFVELDQNYPNPFNPTTTIGFALSHAQTISLIFTDANGREILTHTQHYEAGIHDYNFDGTNYESGIYFYKLVTENPPQTITKKMTLWK